MPEGRRLFPLCKRAASAPRSTRISPFGDLVKAIQCFRLQRATSRGMKRVPSSSPLNMLLRMPRLRPLAMIVAAPARATFSAALILAAIPPVPRNPGMELAYLMTSLFTFSTTLIGRASLWLRGSLSKRPSMSVRLIRSCESVRFVTIALRLSLSPNLISSTTTVSFSLMMGTIFHDSSVNSVFLAFR